jgi:hypothetical protein
MPAVRSVRLLVVAAALAFLPACAVLTGAFKESSGAPSGWLPSADEVGRSGRGAWITIRDAGPRKTTTAGELIAIADDRVHVLTVGGLRTVPAAEIHSAVVALYASGADAQVGASFLTLSHGYWQIFTTPLWWGLVHDTSRAPLVKHPPLPLDGLARFARFPAGLPPGLEPGSLGPLARPRSGKR